MILDDPSHDDDIMMKLSDWNMIDIDVILMWNEWWSNVTI